MSNKTETKKFWCHLYSCFNMRIMTEKLESLKGMLGKIMGPSPLIHSMNLKYSKINTESGNINLENNLFISNIFYDDDSSELFVWYLTDFDPFYDTYEIVYTWTNLVSYWNVQLAIKIHFLRFKFQNSMNMHLRCELCSCLILSWSPWCLLDFL